MLYRLGVYAFWALVAFLAARTIGHLVVETLMQIDDGLWSPE